LLRSLVNVQVELNVGLLLQRNLVSIFLIVYSQFLNIELNKEYMEIRSILRLLDRNLDHQRRTFSSRWFCFLA
jgi:hypothetical protein